MTRILVMAAAALACHADGPEILRRRCLSCHNDTGKMGNLSLSSRQSAARVLEGKLLDRVQRGEMPPSGGLAQEERTEIEKWIAAGAPWDQALESTPRPRAGKDWWALQPVRKSAGTIDELVQRELAKKGLRMNGPADRPTFVRRATFDLTGLPPTPEEVAAFVNDHAAGAEERLIDRLLASPAYGERWGRHWLDVARYGESHGYEQNHVRSNAWPYRDYVIRAFNRDLPFRQFVLEQLAGDVVGKGDPEVEAATGFLVAGPHDTVGNQNEAARRQQRADDLDDMVNATASAFLGLTVNCARCHDHKFDPIQQADYYRLAALLQGVTHAEREIAPAAELEAYRAKATPLETGIRTDKEALTALIDKTKPGREAAGAAVRRRLREPVSPHLTEESFTAREARYVRFRTPVSMASGIDEFEIFTPAGQNVARTAEVAASSTRVADGNADAYHVRHVNDGAFDKRWFAPAGQAASLTFRLAEKTAIQRVAWSADRAKAFQGRFQQQPISNYVLETSLDGETWTVAATGDNRLPHRKEDVERLVTLEALDAAGREAFTGLETRIQRREAELRRLPKPRTVYAGRFQQPAEPMYLLKGGNVMQRGDAIAPASLSALPGFTLPVDAPEQERRLALAQWLGNDANPLTPRVIANRIWHYHFGHGLAGTPSDFGYNGERPTHPELLDLLAARLIENGWRLKPLHREILLSRAYRQSSEWREEAARVDGDARLLWRFPPQRLQAEALRDAMLQTAGVLDRKMGGPSFRLYRYTVDNVATYFPMDKFDTATYRRTVYAESARSIRTELLSVFDCPDSSLPEPRRVVTTSPLQALSLLNHSFTTDMSEAFAKRLRAEDPVTHAFEIAYGRAPSAAEKAQAEALARQHGLAAVARAIFNSNEFVYVH